MIVGPRRWLAPVVAAAALSAMGSALCSCTEYDTSLLHRSSPDASAPPFDAAIEADTLDTSIDVTIDEPATDVAIEAPPPDTASVDAPASCDLCADQSLKRPPCPPEVDDPPGQDQLVFAMRTARLGIGKLSGDDWRSIGLDMDCLATQSNGEPIMCLRSPGSSPTAVQDGNQGIDNSFGHNVGGLLSTMTLLGFIKNDLEESLNNRLETGESGIVFVLSNYGGGDDDPQVTFAMIPSRGTYDAAGTTETLPVWDGNDLWTRESTALVPQGEAPMYSDDSAFVVGGMIVAHLPDGLPIKINSSEATLELALARSTLMLRLSPDRTQITEGALTGVWHTVTAMAALDTYAGQAGLCPDQPEYLAGRQVVETASDIRLDLKPAPNLLCNAVSFGLAFTAQSAQLGAILPPPPTPPNSCAPDGG